MYRIILTSILTVVLISSNILEINSQNEWTIKSNISSNVGYEGNPYKSPDTLYSVLNRRAYTKQELIRPDYFIEYNYDLDITKHFGKKFLLEGTSQWQNKRYSQEKILNTGRFNIGIAPAFAINRKITIGGGYEFEKRAMIDADILGEQTKYVLSYQQNQAQLFLKTKPFKNNITNFYYTFQNKRYSNIYSLYNPVTPPLIELDMDNIQHTIELRMIQNLSKKSKFNTIVSFYDRNYRFLPSYESLLTPNNNIPRHYQDVSIKAALTSKLNNFLQIRPSARYERRMDMYNNYFSYNRFDAGLETWLTYYKFILDIDLLSKIFDYDKFEAPTTGSQPYPPLTYSYLISDITLTYKVIRGIDIETEYNFEKRNSNANRPTWKYRRGYDDFIVKGGIVIYPDILFNL